MFFHCHYLGPHDNYNISKATWPWSCYQENNKQTSLAISLHFYYHDLHVERQQYLLTYVYLTIFDFYLCFKPVISEVITTTCTTSQTRLPVQNLYIHHLHGSSSNITCALYVIFTKAETFCRGHNVRQRVMTSWVWPSQEYCHELLLGPSNLRISQHHLVHTNAANTASIKP